VLKFWTRICALAILLCLLAPAAAGAAAETAERIVLVADSRSHTGWQAWLSNLYNENLVYFTLVTVLVIPTLGALLGAITSFLLARLGVNLRSRVLAEH
jgi:hypothetical protein